jgi:F-type H+-transporting ATPase subunit epsilon
MSELTLEIISPEKKIFEGRVKFVQVPGTKGSFGILLNHAPIISTLDAGNVVVKESNDKETVFNIKGGVVEVLNNRISVLVTE